MRNLKLQYCQELLTGVAQPRQLLLQPELNGDASDTAFLLADSKIYAVQASGDVPPKVIADLPDIVGAEFLQLDNAICVASGAGEVLLIDPQTGATTEGTYCEVGIERMAWSPNQEVVVFVTRTHNVVLMSSTFDVIGEHPLNADLAPDQQFVNVGWGKKETQFHGSEGKQAAKQPIGGAASASQDWRDLNQDIHISWRGDGAHFVISYVDPQLGRTFKVYDCEGKLEHTAEKSADLQEVVTWRPAGNWIALPQRFPNKSTIALFEKNGLRHRELVLPFDLQEEAVVQLRWSEDSDILAIRTATKEEQRVYLFTIGNYHWYLKQVLIFDQVDPLALLHWDTRMGAEHTLHILMESGTQFIYHWAFAVSRHESNGVVGVIDGKRLLLTDFTRAVVPPPMCQRVLQLENYINAIIWCGSCLSVYTCDRKVHFYGPINQLSDQEPPASRLVPDVTLSRITLANLTYFNRDYLLATWSKGASTDLLLLNMNLGKNYANDQGELCYSIKSYVKISGLVNALSLETNEFYVQTVNNGHSYKVSVSWEMTLKVERTHVQLAQAADQIEWFTLGSSVAGLFNDSLPPGVLITLRNQQLLHIDDQRIAEDVTSFCVVGNYLAYTQLNALHFVRMKDRRQVASRNIERGGKLVTSVASEARVVLQLPRGNLEAICPRVLVLELVGALLSARKYQAAMQMLRKQRINLNIICDHNVNQFVDSLSVFLREIEQSQWLCLFLSELQNEDFSKGMYSSNYEAAKQTYPDDYRVEEKVEYVCRLLLELMEMEYVERFRLPVITAYVKLGRLEQALQLIWQEKQTDAGLADQLLKYLLYLVDVNDLYNVALGTYDFGLVLFVAQKSQKDPKEFLPYLNELKALPMDYRKFRIDDHLKRYPSALSHLAACGEQHYDEALKFIQKHGLYTAGLTCYREHEEFHKRVCVAYGDHLRANAKLDNASLMYERGGQLQQALLSAKNTLDWQRVLVLAKKLGEPLDQMALSLVEPLKQQGRHMEAYELVKDHGGDRKRQLEVLLEGHLYSRAIYEAGLQQGDALAEKVAPALLAYGAQLLGSLQADLKLFLEYKQRLLDIRQRQARSGDADNDEDVDIQEVDLLSDTTSLHSSRYSSTSRGTGKTFRSSKNRRKHERKLLSLKPGNPFEDIALIDALHNHVTKIAQQQQPVRDTCKALLQLDGSGAPPGDGDSLAASLQREFKTLLKAVESSLDEIWTPELVSYGSATQHLTGPNVDYLALQKEQRYALISPLKRFKPQLNLIDWQHEILQ